MSNSLNITPEQARAIVLRAATRNGWISEEDRNNSPARTLEALENAREQLGNALQAISRDLGSSNSRVALELIQNAEDNEFTLARRFGQQPYIRFQVRPTSIIVECNEDGFTEENVTSISTVAQSSKNKDRGYIGEKGIGFKSVFQVARAVHIQSNSFSFSFQYGEGETRDNLGIVTPIVEDELIPIDARPLTRMTLTPFHAEEVIPYASLVAKFKKSIPDNLLLFLTTLKKIEILCQHPDERTTLTTFKKIEKDNGRMVHLLKSVEDEYRNGTFLTETPPDRYRISKKDITQLPPHRSRPNIHSCEVVLAFPVDEASLPLISLQLCFAFLPIRTTNFRFIIQADFILTANREDIVNTPRNTAILQGVAEIFRDAVLQFVDSDSPLRFKWTKYLPDAQTLGGVWDMLPAEITRLLSMANILYSQESPTPCQPSQLRILPSLYRDSSGLPLFRDRPGRNKKYLHQQYDHEDIEIFRDRFGLQDIADMHMYRRIKQDLKSSHSKMMSRETDDDWHSRAASLILSILCRASIGLTNMIRELPLIPLSNGEWVNASHEELYYPAETGPEIPRDLMITVDPVAAANVCRKFLFTKLGVVDIHPKTVIDRLFTYYSRSRGASDLSFSMAHVSYLYWHHENKDDSRLSLVWLYETHGRQITSRRNLMYFKTEDEYGPYKLLKSYEYPSKNIPECPVAFLKPEYMALFSPFTWRHGSSWLKWLEKGLGVRRVPRIKYDGGSLSTEFRHIIRYRPDKLVGTLKKHWDNYEDHMSPPILCALSRSKVTCVGGQLRSLKSTYLPLQDMKDRAQSFGIGQEFPFLKMPLPLQVLKDIAPTFGIGPKFGLLEVSSNLEGGVVLRDWRFLQDFDVGVEPDLDFYVEILQQQRRKRYTTWGNESREKILNAYEFIADNYSETQRDGLRKKIDARGLILDPSSFQKTASGPTWIEIQSCAWRGPVDLLEKKPLAEVPEYRTNQKLSKFFCEILGIEDTTWIDYLEMISNLRRQTESSPNLPQKILTLYRLLLNDGRSTPDWTHISERFQTEGLVYIPLNSSWVSPSDCLWDSPVPIDGKPLILQSYPEELKPFFLEHLRIPAASLDTLVKEVFDLATQHPTVQRVKELIWAINGMRPGPNDLNILSTSIFLPVRVKRPEATRQIEFRGCQSDFAIVDRAKLADIFEGHVGFLDFSLEDVLQLKPFLTSLDLGSKYLSLLCREETDCQGEYCLDNRLTVDFHSRAYGRLRCAVSYRSEIAALNAQSLLSKLCGASIFRTNHISTKYTIQLSREAITRQILGGNVHIKEQENEWDIYVPDNRRARELCYSLSFPKALTKLFGIAPAAREIISNVLNKPIYILDAILEAEGIGMVPDIAPQPRPTADESSAEDTSNEEVIAVEDIVVSSRSSRAPGTPTPSARLSHSPPAADQIHETPDLPSLEIADEGIYYSPVAYQELLENVLRLASQTNLPHINSRAGVGNNHFLQGFDRLTAFGMRSQGQMTHDTKIGAAGEVFIFEILSALGLPGFGRPNWESTIRGLVAIHPRYTGLENWRGRETADITYDDQFGIFTAMLIAKGYLDGQVWRDARPKYFMEVKTTTGQCGDRFYLSTNQYQLMQRYTSPLDQAVPNVYIIFRVFNLGRNNLGVKLYVDPERHRLRGNLEFESQTWTVRPRM